MLVVRLVGEGTETEARSLDELLKDLASGEHNNDLIAELERGKRSKEVASLQPDVILGSTRYGYGCVTTAAPP